MSLYSSLSNEVLNHLKQELQGQLKAFAESGRKLDMSRGKPSTDQLDLSIGMLNCFPENKDCFTQNGTDCRTYGMVDGIPEAKALFAQMLGVRPDEIIVGGNSSLALMHDTITRAMLLGLPGSDKPWCKLDKVKFLCPVPGYDRHFTICETFGIEMISIPMTPEGPDMDEVRRLVESDESVKGIWNIPKYSNPTGITYSDAVVDAFAALKPKAGDFRIFWDNAYCVHHLTEEHDTLKNILEACRAQGNEDMVLIFGSTSKISYAGAGVAMMAASKANISYFKKMINAQTICPDKLNQLRHVRYFKDLAGIESHMKKHAALLKPKFDLVEDILERELSGAGVAQWTKPRGGYFISVNVMDGCAARCVELCSSAGVTFTPAGATFPYGRDPRDRNIRISPTCPPIDELKEAMELFCVSAKLACIEKLLSSRQGTQ